MSARFRVAREERGLGLPELPVAILLVGILSTLVVTFYSSATRTFTTDRAATDSTMIAAVGMKELTRVIRSGTEIPVDGATLNKPVFISADSEKVVLHAYLDTDSESPQPVLVEFAVDPDSRDLIETRWTAQDAAGYWVFPNTEPESQRPVARHIAELADSPAPLFSFLTADGTSVSVPMASSDIASLRSIVAVEVSLTVQSDPIQKASPVTLRNTVGIPNLGISRVGP